MTRHGLPHSDERLAVLRGPGAITAEDTSTVLSMGTEREGSVVRPDFERLYSAARHHARAASDKMRSPNENLRMDAAIHAGAAVELMAKAILTSVDHRLLYEDRDGHHVVIDLLVRAEKATAEPYARKNSRTVTAGMAVDLAARLCEHVRPHAQGARRALAARNSAAHAAEVHEATLVERVTGGSEFVLAGVVHFARSPVEFLGRDLVEQVERDVEERNIALRAASWRKVSGAKGWYEALVAPLSVDGRQALLSELGKRQSAHGDHNERYPCPACGNAAWLIWNVEMDVDWDGPGDYSANAYLDFRGLDCLFCNLQLNDVESESIGINPHGDPAADFGGEDR